MHAIDTLIRRTVETRNPTVVGLDPDLHKLPACYKQITSTDDPLRDTAETMQREPCDVLKRAYPICY